MVQDRRSPITNFPVQRIVDYMNSKEQLPFVLLGIGPMSGPIIRTGLEVARDAQSPAMIIASRNQVETEAWWRVCRFYFAICPEYTLRSPRSRI